MKFVILVSCVLIYSQVYSIMTSEEKVKAVLDKPTQGLKQKSQCPLHHEKLLENVQTNPLPADRADEISSTTDQLNKLFDEFDTNHDNKIDKRMD